MTPIKPNKAIAPDFDKYPLVFDKWGSPKLDGIRGLSQLDTCYTKSLHLVPNLAVVAMMREAQGLDGEFIWGSPTAPDVCAKTMSAVMTIKGSTDNLMFYAFDILDLSLTFEQRYDKLLGKALPGFVKVLPQTPIRCQADLDRLHAKNLEDGYEGSMLRNGAALYKQGRSTAKSQDLLKIKPYMDSEAIVLQVYEAMTNNNEEFIAPDGRTARSSHAENLEGKGMAGGFTVQMGDKIFNVAAGSLTHAERIEVWLNSENYIGRLLTFRHMPYGEKDVPRHTRFKCWRDPRDM